ncbi:hypothetical protein ACQY0O_003344 [Thecaphora frezii]
MPRRHRSPQNHGLDQARLTALGHIHKDERIRRFLQQQASLVGGASDRHRSHNDRRTRRSNRARADNCDDAVSASEAVSGGQLVQAKSAVVSFPERTAKTTSKVAAPAVQGSGQSVRKRRRTEKKEPDPERLKVLEIRKHRRRKRAQAAKPSAIIPVERRTCPEDGAARRWRGPENQAPARGQRREDENARIGQALLERDKRLKTGRLTGCSALQLGVFGKGKASRNARRETSVDHIFSESKFLARGSMSDKPSRVIYDSTSKSGSSRPHFGIFDKDTRPRDKHRHRGWHRRSESTPSSLSSDSFGTSEKMPRQNVAKRHQTVPSTGDGANLRMGSRSACGNGGHGEDDDDDDETSCAGSEEVSSGHSAHSIQLRRRRREGEKRKPANYAFNQLSSSPPERHSSRDRRVSEALTAQRDTSQTLPQPTRRAVRPKETEQALSRLLDDYYSANPSALSNGWLAERPRYESSGDEASTSSLAAAIRPKSGLDLDFARLQWIERPPAKRRRTGRTGSDAAVRKHQRTSKDGVRKRVQRTLSKDDELDRLIQACVKGRFVSPQPEGPEAAPAPDDGSRGVGKSCIDNVGALKGAATDNGAGDGDTLLDQTPAASYPHRIETGSICDACNSCNASPRSCGLPCDVAPTAVFTWQGDGIWDRSGVLEGRQWGHSPTFHEPSLGCDGSSCCSCSSCCEGAASGEPDLPL